MSTFPGKLAIQQRVLPGYRTPFFELLAQSCSGGLSLFAGEPRPAEAIKTARSLEDAQLFLAHNRHFLGGAFYLCNQTNIIPWLEDFQPDALVIEANPRYLSSSKAISWMHARGKPVLGWSLGAPPVSGPLAGIRRAFRLRFLSKLNGYISYSQRGADEHIALGLPPDKVFVAHNAAAPRPISPPPARPQEFSPATLLFVGRLQARKKLEMLFRACAALPSDQQPRLLIVGDGPARQDFETQAKQLYPRAEFLGAKHGPELDPIYAQADLFVLPGTGGLAIQQAMSHALPVIVAQGDGTQEDLVRPGNGWLITPDSQTSLNAALAEALSDHPRLRGMGVESYRITAEEINLEQMAAAFVRAVNKISTLAAANY
jgi:glycosyltransferase involved in cell wall biosynthesis